MDLDLIDRKLLYYLDLNARENIASIAKRLRIGRNVALYRVNRLKEKGIIKGAFAEINNPALGYLSFRIFLKLGNFRKERENLLLDHLKKEPSLMWLSRVIGRWDLDLVIMTKKIKEFELFRRKLFEQFNEIIESSHISLLTKICHYPKDYLISNKRNLVNPTILETIEEVSIEEKDKKILSILTSDAFTNIIDISRKVGISINTVKKKIRDLEKNKIISGYRIFIDPSKLGYEYYKLHLSLRNYSGSDIQNLQNWLSKNGSVIYLDNYINGEDFEIELHLKNEKEYLDFLKNLYIEFSGIIKDHFLLKFYDIMVYRYFPVN